MRRLCVCVLAAYAGVACLAAEAVPDSVPVLLRTEAGETVTTREAWERVRRPEVLKTMCTRVYGERPVERPADLAFEQIGVDEICYGGAAVKKVIRGSYTGGSGRETFTLTAWIPRTAGRHGAFVHLSPRPTPGADDPKGPRPVYTLPAAYIVSRGYAAVAVCDYEFAPDFFCVKGNATNGVFRAFGPKNAAARAPSEWGILSAWAWGASRALDWIETEPTLDATRVGVVGLSRNGKAALVAGATDPRFALTVSCCSGTGGAKLNHMKNKGSETVKQIMKPAWMWFCPRFAEWIGRDREMPFDQHWLLALMAPRLLYVSSATKDDWAGPRGEFAAGVLASAAWGLYGLPGLTGEFPKPDVPVQAGRVGYHLRSGKHAIMLYDWQRYIDFADRHGLGVQSGK